VAGCFVFSVVLVQPFEMNFLQAFAFPSSEWKAETKQDF